VENENIDEKTVGILVGYIFHGSSTGNVIGRKLRSSPQ